MFPARWLSSLALVPVLLASPGLLAQDAPAIPAGSRIRVTSGFRPTETGRFVNFSGDSLRYVSDRWADTLLVPPGNLTGLEVSSGRHHRVLHRLGAGALVGGLVGAALGGVGWAASGNDSSFGTPADWLAILTASGALLGGAIGALSGAIGTSETWQKVPTDQPRVHVSLMPTGHRGAVVALHVNF